MDRGVPLAPVVRSAVPKVLVDRVPASAPSVPAARPGRMLRAVPRATPAVPAATDPLTTARGATGRWATVRPAVDRRVSGAVPVSVPGARPATVRPATGPV